jgi:hypothetical protein
MIVTVPSLVDPSGRRMRRRQFLKLLGGAAVEWPIASRAHRPATPVIQRSPAESANIVAAFRQRLREEGYGRGMWLSNFALPKGKSIGCRR